LELTDGGGHKTQTKLPLVQDTTEEEREGADDGESGQVIRSETDMLLECGLQKKVRIK